MLIKIDLLIGSKCSDRSGFHFQGIILLIVKEKAFGHLKIRKTLCVKGKTIVKFMKNTTKLVKRLLKGWTNYGV